MNVIFTKTIISDSPFYFGIKWMKSNSEEVLIKRTWNWNGEGISLICKNYKILYNSNYYMFYIIYYVIWKNLKVFFYVLLLKYYIYWISRYQITFVYFFLLWKNVIHYLKFLHIWKNRKYFCLSKYSTSDQMLH